MALRKEKTILLLVFLLALALLAGLCLLRGGMHYTEHPRGTYAALAPDESGDDPLRFLGEDFSVGEGFHTNLPIVILSLDTELPDYKRFQGGEEIVTEGLDPYTTGTLRIIDTGAGVNTTSDPPVCESLIRIKRKGHSSYNYDKQQYKLKTILPDGTDNSADLLGMGRGSEWVLNGSMADKSMLRNYLAYRIASEIDGNTMAPDCRYCEVLTEQDGTLAYQGVFLLMETVSRGKDRVNIEKYDEEKTYSGYIVRRDRQTTFDLMLNTWGRESGIAKGHGDRAEQDNWIGLKYPSASRITEQTVRYIEQDFSQIERVLYSEDDRVFRLYDKYIDVDSFVDYFLINEFFGNYDAGEHSTYMYKNAGDLLHMGPVWDYDQALDNSRVEELNTADLAFQTQTFFAELCRDRRFVSQLQKRYSRLRREQLSEEHVFSVIDETAAYLRSARVREWYRWAADYLDDSGDNWHNYHLEPYEIDDVKLSRFTDVYDQELVVIKTYLHKHGQSIPEDLTDLAAGATMDTTTGGMREFAFVIAITMFLLPTYLINKKG